MSPEPGPQGVLVAVVGPSGAGKDTLIRLALEALAPETRLHLARRVVTRPADGGSEDHDSLDTAAFEEAEAKGAFCLTWRAHGLAYGLPKSVEVCLAAGGIVLANLSRRSLAEAARRFGRIAVVEITASRELLVARIAARGREAPGAIAARLARQVPLEAPPGALAVVTIDNSGRPEMGAARLAQELRTLLRTTAAG